jgi:cytoskeletal protein CcmA (bactofilin family)
MKFGNSRELAGEPASKPSAPSIGVEVTITGNIEAGQDLHIEGSVVGDVRCQTLYLGETGKISGNIHAARVRVAGTVEGGIEARDLAVEATARVTGDVTYGRLRVANGAAMEGKLKWERPAEVVAHKKPDETGPKAEPAPTPIEAKAPIHANSPFPRRHHGPRGKAEPIRGPIGAVEPTMTFTDDALIPRLAQ